MLVSLRFQLCGLGIPKTSQTACIIFQSTYQYFRHRHPFPQAHRHNLKCIFYQDWLHFTSGNGKGVFTSCYACAFLLLGPDKTTLDEGIVIDLCASMNKPQWFV